VRAVYALLLLTLLAAPPAAADVFTVRGVEVDQTAGSAVEAKQAATDQGQLLAAQRLFERLTLEEDRFALPPLDAATAARLGAGYQFEEEAATGSRYIGRMAVSFDPMAVRELLESYNVPYVASSARPAVIVPLWSDQGGTRLWDDNPWLEAWSVAGTADELVPVITPTGDLNDIAAIDAPRARELNMAALQQLAANYGSSHVLVALAEPGATEGTVSARMLGIDFGNGGARQDYGRLPAGEPVEVARAAAALLQDSWKRALIVRDPTVSQMSLTVLISSLRDWTELRTIIGNEPLVEDFVQQSLTTDAVSTTLSHRGTPEQLQLALSAQGIELFQDPTLGWTARRMGAAFEQ
jgi:hypothetical protein